VVRQEVRFPSQAVGRLQDRFDGRWLEERKLLAGEPDAVLDRATVLLPRGSDFPEDDGSDFPEPPCARTTMRWDSASSTDIPSRRLSSG
jgi:hypothetical protein